MEIIHWIGIDDHADKWTIAHLRGSEEKVSKEFELIPDQAGFRCDVATPSLTPQKPGQRVKTNRRDALKLARYLRAGELTLIVVPDQGRESLRDLIRARSAGQKDLLSIRHQIAKLLLRYGHRYRDGRAWTKQFWSWLKKIRLEGEHGQFVLEEMIIAHDERLERVGRYNDAIEKAASKSEYAPYVAALRVLRGIDTLSAMTILAELGDLRRFGTAPQLMAAVGLVPAEYSTGDKTTRLSITKAGNAHIRRIVVEAAWHYERRVTNGPKITRRRRGQAAELLEITSIPLCQALPGAPTAVTPSRLRCSSRLGRRDEAGPRQLHTRYRPGT